MRPIKPTDHSLTFESINGIGYYISRFLLEEHRILIAFTTRLGGVSREPYSSLNLALHVGDNSEFVLNNRKMLCNLFDLDFERMVCAEQVHGTDLAVVNESDIGKGAFSLAEVIKGVDALITDKPLIPLVLFFADCVPVILVSLEKRTVGVVHAGWRGVYGNIIKNATETMIAMQSNPSGLLAFIGPSIGGCCYKVSRDLVKAFSKKFNDHKDWLNGDHIDLRKIGRMQLIESGIPVSNIYICDDCCTSCHDDIFFSYRSAGGTTGRQAALATILEQPIAK